MPRRSIDERIAESAARLAKLQARKRSADRKADTKRKVLVGALVLDRIQRDPALAAWLRHELGSFLTREADRDLCADLLGLVDPADADDAAPAPNGRVAP